MYFQRILLPTDFSEHSAAAADHARELAERLGAELHVLHLLETHLTTTPLMGMGVILPGRSHESQAAAERKLETFIGPPLSTGRTIIRTVAEGPPVEGIIRYAHEHDIDLIVLSMKGLNALAQVILGNVSEGVLHKAHCPVMTIRPAALLDKPA